MILADIWRLCNNLSIRPDSHVEPPNKRLQPLDERVQPLDKRAEPLNE